MANKKSEETIEANVGQEVEINFDDAAENNGYGKTSLIGIRLVSNQYSDLIGHLTDDKQGGRYVLQNPAEIKYKEVTEGEMKGRYSIVFVPFAPSSDGTVFIPYGQVGFVFEPKEDIKKEYLSKFQHTQSTGVKTQPKFEG